MGLRSVDREAIEVQAQVVEIDIEIVECDPCAQAGSRFFLNDGEHVGVEMLAMQEHVYGSYCHRQENQKTGEEPADDPPYRMMTAGDLLLCQIGFGVLVHSTHLRMPVQC